MAGPVTVLFACVHNAGRSQMAAALFNQMSDPARARAISAGTRPADCVHAVVVEAMCESGLDLSAATPRLLTPELAAGVDRLVTMGCAEQCPALPGVRREDWPLPDPRDEPLARVREIRDAIRERVASLIAAEGW